MHSAGPACWRRSAAPEIGIRWLMLHKRWSVLMLTASLSSSSASILISSSRASPTLSLRKKNCQNLKCDSTQVPVIAVNDEDESLGVLEVVAPEWPDLVLNRKYIERHSIALFCWTRRYQTKWLYHQTDLTTDVPHCEADVLVFHSLHIET